MTGTGFIYETHSPRVVFGAGTLSLLANETAKLGMSKPLIITTPRGEALGRKAAEHLDLPVVFCPIARMHTPVETTKKAIERASEASVDGLISIGGGSTTGLGKALAVRTGLPHLCIATTYAGSEMTPILGETENARKITRRAAEILPHTVLYDISLTLDLPASIRVVSGFNAMAHAVEALYAFDRNPVVDLMAERSIGLLAGALPKILADPADISARSAALEGAWMGGACLAAVTMGLHHKLCHTLGGSFDLPHGETHSVILPYAIRFIAPTAPDAVAAICRALNCDEAATGIRELAERLNAPTSLAQLGMPKEGIELATKQSMEQQYWSPRPLQSDEIKTLLTAAWKGTAP